MHAIGIDVGSTSIKAAILNLQHRTVENIVQSPFPDPLPNRTSGHVEIDADEVVERCRRLIIGLLDLVEPKAVLFCGQHGGLVLIDSKKNRLTPYISWRDLRTTESSEEVSSRTNLQQLSAQLGDQARLSLGNELASGGTVALLYWFRQHQQLPKSVTPLGIAEYVLMRLGNASPVIEPTCAIGMLDFSTMAHARPIFDQLGLNEVKWPELKSYLEPVGGFWQDGKRIPMHPVIGDHQCALLGAAFSEGELSLNISTGSQVSVLTREPKLSTNYQTRCFFDGVLLNTLTHLPAGRALNALVDLLTEIPTAAGIPIDDPWKWIARLTEHQEKTDLKAKITLFPGPFGSRGEFSNISVDNLHISDLFLAAFNNMVDHFAEAARRIDPTQHAKQIVFSGGLVQKLTRLRELIITRFQMPYRENNTTEETLTGLLKAAQVICGLRGSVFADET